MQGMSVPFVVRTVVVLAHLVGLAALGAPGPVTALVAAALVGTWAVPVLVRGERLHRVRPAPARAG